MHPSRFYSVVSGEDRTAAATVARHLLRLAEVPYAAAVRWRNRRFDRSAAVQAGVPVISVGNLTLGGTGKTPLVAWLADHLTSRGWRVAILSRGYGGDRQGNDEGRELQQRLPQVRLLQHPNRVQSAKTAIQEYGSQILLLDDGFQHRRLHRDLDVVLLDGHSPFGYGHLFPRGTLREPVSGLARADVVGLTRADQLTDAARRSIQRQVAEVAGSSLWCELAHVPRCLMNAAGASTPFESLRHQPAVAFCGIGNPRSFRQLLTDRCALQLTGFREFPDHHRFTPRDLTDLANWAADQGAAAALCTQKDLVKINQLHLGDLPLWALQVEMEFLTGAAQLLARLDTLLEQYGVTPPNHPSSTPHGTDSSAQCA